MDGVDKEKVQRIVYEMSKGSKYFENEQRKEAFIKQKIESLRIQVDKLTDKDISHFQMVSARNNFFFSLPPSFGVFAPHMLALCDGMH